MIFYNPSLKNENGVKNCSVIYLFKLPCSQNVLVVTTV